MRHIRKPRPKSTSVQLHVFPALVASGNGHVAVVWSYAEALAESALALTDQLAAERLQYEIAAQVMETAPPARC